MRLDAAALRAEADAHEERLKGPLWADGTGGDGGDGEIVGGGGGADGEEAPVLVSSPKAMSASSTLIRRPPGINPDSTRPNRRQGGQRPPPGTSSMSRRPMARKVGRPATETLRLPPREVRIPIVVDERAREVAAWEGIEPIEAMWMLCTRGWETWRRAHDAPVEIPT